MVVTVLLCEVLMLMLLSVHGLWPDKDTRGLLHALCTWLPVGLRLQCGAPGLSLQFGEGLVLANLILILSKLHQQGRSHLVNLLLSKSSARSEIDTESRPMMGPMDMIRQMQQHVIMPLGTDHLDRDSQCLRLVSQHPTTTPNCRLSSTRRPKPHPRRPKPH